MIEIISLVDAVAHQVAVDDFLRSAGIKNLVGDYGELLSKAALGGELMPLTFTGYDLKHTSLGRVQVKTRRWERKFDGGLRKESCAVGFKIDRPNEFDHLCHIVFNDRYRVELAALATYTAAWPEVSYANLRFFSGYFLTNVAV